MLFLPEGFRGIRCSFEPHTLVKKLLFLPGVERNRRVFLDTKCCPIRRTEIFITVEFLRQR